MARVMDLPGRSTAMDAPVPSDLPDPATPILTSEAGIGAGAPGRASDRGAQVSLVDSTGRLSEAELGWIAGQAVAALEKLGQPGELRVRIVADAEMAAAHMEYLEVEGTTDVLTFDMSEQGLLDVDILACVDEAQRRAGDLGHDRARELLLYIVHGVLHCLGYDDHEPEAYQRMHAKEDAILEAIGAGATFARSQPLPGPGGPT